MVTKQLDIEDTSAVSIKEAALTRRVVSGHTHNFYRYPARFSPLFAQQIIKEFTDPGDYVLDPFVGGGTTIVEARSLGRRAIGIDINSLATFITEAKTNLLSSRDIVSIKKWSQSLPEKLSLKNTVKFDSFWENYLRNINSRSTWPIRNTIQLGIDYAETLDSSGQIIFARCALLNSSQWALDSKKILPAASEFRGKIQDDVHKMLQSADNYSRIVNFADSAWKSDGLRKVKLFNKKLADLSNNDKLDRYPSPKLILTSPPYPGVHVLYHRWQVDGRKETPAPYWIANRLDGSGESYYTFGPRHEDQLTSYFKNTYQSFKTLSKIADHNTTIVQMIAFSEPKWQLPLYLETLSEAGFSELASNKLSNSKDGRLWRQVPNRKWHANVRGQTSSSNEVVLFHKLKH